MVVAAPYTQGTISLDPDDASIVVGNGTLWATVALANDQIEALGISVSISEVIDDTHLQLYYDWPGTAPDGDAYVLKFTSEKRGSTSDLAAVVRDQINRLRIFDHAVAVFSVKQFAVNAPPGDAIVGDRFVVGTSGTSDFAGHNNEIAEKTETGYLFTIPQHGYHVIDEEQNFVRAWTGSEWGGAIGLGAALAFIPGGWNDTYNFKPGNITTHADRVWVSQTDNTNSEPAADSDDWDIFINVGEDGGAFTLRYIFNSDTDDSSPGDGALKFNNVAGSATIVRASKTDIYGNDWSELLASIATSTTSVQKGKIRVTAKGDKTKQVIATVMNATLVADDYYNITMSGVQTSLADLVDGDGVVFTFSERGDKGANGDTGPQGVKGNTGDAATIAVGMVTTLEPGSSATVTNSGTSGAAVFDFEIPSGEKGDQGQGIQPDASGTLSGRDTYDGEAAGFVYLRTDVTPFEISVKLSSTGGDWSAASPVGGAGDMLKSDNLAGLDDADASLDNLGASDSGKAVFTGTPEDAREAIGVEQQRANILIDRIYLSKALIALQRRFDECAGGFKSSDNVSSGSSSNYSLDTTNGLVKPTSTAGTMISAATGTLITDTTTRTSAIFDGVTNQASSAAAQKASATSLYAGKTYSGGKTVGKAMVYGTNNLGFVASGTPSITVNLRGKNGTAPSSPSNGTLLGTLTFTNTSNESAGRTVNSSDTTTNYDHVFVEILQSAGAGTMCLAEVQFYAPGTTSNMTVVTTPQTTDASVENARCLIVYDNTATPTLNTDLTVELSCDGGSTWSTTTLALVTAYGPEGLYVAETDDVACTAGTSFTARIKTLNNKMIEIHGVSISVH